MLLSLLALPPEGARLGMMNCRRGYLHLHLRYSIRIRRLQLLFFRDLRVWELDVGTRKIVSGRSLFCCWRSLLGYCRYSSWYVA